MRLRAKPVAGLARERKARMIQAFLEDALGQPPRDLSVLDVGCGNGDIGAYFASTNWVVGLDVVDQCRREHSGFSRVLAMSETMPFKSASFDVVISHHVIEHVASHQGHLAELRRVVKPNGTVYLGTPNRSSPLMRGHVGNDMVLRYAEMRPLFEHAGFEVEECYTRLLSRPLRYHCETRIGALVPRPLLHAMRRWYPSQCFLLRPAPSAMARR